jgi:hypothetical protein
MRRAARPDRRALAVGALALAGCNQVLGLAATREIDAALPDLPHVVLDYQLPGPAYQPISPAPRVQIAPLDGAFGVDPAAYGSDGAIVIPTRYAGTTWRLEYTIAGGVPHEVQWAPADKQGHVTVPAINGLDRAPLPPGAGYAIAPTGTAGPFTEPRVFTTGMWSEGAVPGFVAGSAAQVDYGLASAVGLAGAPAQLRAGDGALLLDFRRDATTGCRVAVGGAVLADPVPQAPHATATPRWETMAYSFDDPPLGTTQLTRLQQQLGPLQSMAGKDLSFKLVGTLAAPGLPPFASAPAAASNLGVLLPVPVMVTWQACTYNQAGPAPAVPSALLAPAVVRHVQLVDTRKLVGITLVSGLETVDAVAATPAFPAQLATQIHLTGPAGVDLDLAGAADQLALPATAGPLRLAFVPDTAGAAPHTDYYEVTLDKVAGRLEPARVFTVTQPSVRIDPAVLEAHTEYLFEIRGVTGQPGAASGDFATVRLPYSTAVVVTRTFRTP